MLFRVTACIRSSLHASRWISLSCSLACKTPWRGRKLNEIYVLRKQCGNLCCAVERGCYHIIIKLRWADQMWNLDKEFFGSACGWLYWKSRESCRQHKMPPCPQVIVWLWSGLVWSLHPVISPLLTQVSHEEHPCAVESPGCLGTQMVWFCPSYYCQAVSEEKRAFWILFFFHFIFKSGHLVLSLYSAELMVVHWIFVGIIVGLSAS